MAFLLHSGIQQARKDFVLLRDPISNLLGLC
jgi:hypothetical protein